MSNRCNMDRPLVENLYAFLGWVVAYSDYGKELAVDTVLNRLKLIDRVDEGRVFRSTREFNKYERFLNDYRNDKRDIYELSIPLTDDEVARCEELRELFTPRFKRAKVFTREQIEEYKVKRVFFGEDSLNEEIIEPVKLVDHESKEVVAVFSSGTAAAREFKANIKSIRDAVNKRAFYKGYIWMPCDERIYIEYEETFGNKMQMSKNVV